MRWLVPFTALLYFMRTEVSQFLETLSFERAAPWKESGAVLISLAVAWLLGFLVGRYRRHYRTQDLQNRGEARLSRAVKTTFKSPNYHLLNHVTLRFDGGTTQIDHILISRFGIFVIETKDHRGWIFAGGTDRKWTQVLYRVKFSFQNPIRQNFKHVCAIRELLEFLPPEVIHSAVVFTGKAIFKTAVPEGVFTLKGLLDFIASHETEVMSANRVQFCVGRLETARLSISNATDVEHVEWLRRRYGQSD